MFILRFSFFFFFSSRRRHTSSLCDWSSDVCSSDLFVLVLAPFAPHHAEEMWGLMGQPYSVHEEAWPEWDGSLIVTEEITLVVQVNGKLRDRIEAPADVSAEVAKELALASEKVRPHVEGREIRKSVYVPGRLVNFVVG